MAEGSPTPLRARVTRTSAWTSPEVQTADEVGAWIGRSADWIRSRTGVDRRHVWTGDPAVQAAHAARPLLESGPVDLIVNASLTPRQLIPDTSVFVARELGLEGTPSFSVHATCLSFVVGLQVAALHVHAGLARRVLLVSSEVASPSRDPEQPESAALLGDGAAAALIEATPPGQGSCILDHVMHTFPSGAELTEFRGAGVMHHPNDPDTTAQDNLFQMQGPRIYRHARRRVGELLDELWARNDLSPDRVDLVVPHQASGHGLAALSRYGFREDRIVDILAEYGNCIAASVPMALAHAEARGRLKRGDTVLLVGTGAGLSVAGTLLVW